MTDNPALKSKLNRKNNERKQMKIIIIIKCILILNIFCVTCQTGTEIVHIRYTHSRVEWTRNPFFVPWKVFFFSLRVYFTCDKFYKLLVVRCLFQLTHTHTHTDTERKHSGKKYPFSLLKCYFLNEVTSGDQNDLYTYRH